jgi:hypothetical protein
LFGNLTMDFTTSKGNVLDIVNSVRELVGVKEVMISEVEVSERNQNCMELLLHVLFTKLALGKTSSNMDRDQAGVRKQDAAVNVWGGSDIYNNVWGGSNFYSNVQSSHALYNTKMGNVIAITRDRDKTTNQFNYMGPVIAQDARSY